jgi:virginiamycin B lyase
MRTLVRLMVRCSAVVGLVVSGLVFAPAAHANPAGTIVEFPVAAASGPAGMVAGPDGNLWFAELAGDAIGRFVPATREVTDFPTPTAGSSPAGITVGPDRNLWFTEPGVDKIGRSTIDGAITEFLIPTPGAQPFGIATGAGGALWFMELNGNAVGRITTDGR